MRWLSPAWCDVEWRDAWEVKPFLIESTPENFQYSKPKEAYIFSAQTATKIGFGSGAFSIYFFTNDWEKGEAN